MKRITTTFLSLFLALVTSAKDIDISGKVVDAKTGKALSYITFAIYNTTDSVVFTTLIDNPNGEFYFKNIKINKEKYKLIFALGFELRKTIEIDGSKVERHLKLGTVELSEFSQEIEEVKVTGTKKTGREVGKTIYKIDTSYYKEVVNTGDLLRKIPLIKVDALGHNATILGKQNVFVMINGINTGISIDLRRVNFRDVESVEVVTLPPSNIDKSYDGVINIVLKKEIRHGYEFGIEDMFRLPGHDNDLYTGVAYGTDQFKIEFLYWNYYRKGDWRDIKIREDTAGFMYKIDGLSDDGYERDHTFYVNLDWHITNNDYFNITTETNHGILDRDYKYKAFYKNKLGPEQPISPFVQTKMYDYTIGNYTAHYRHNFKNKQSDWFALTGNFGFTTGQDGYQTKYDSIDNSIDTLINSLENIHRQSASLVLDYHAKVSDNFTIDAGAQGFWRNLISDINRVKISKNNITNREGNIFADFNYDHNKWAVKLGLKGEFNNNHFGADTIPTNTKYAFLPSLGAIFRIDSISHLELTYRKTVGYPRIWDLAPYTIERNNKTFYTGNPKLQPQTMQHLSLYYYYRHPKIKVAAGADWLPKKNMFWMERTFDDSLNQHERVVNKGSRHRFASYLQAQISAVKYFSVTPTAILYYDIFKTEGEPRKGFHYSLHLALNLFLPHYFSIYTDMAYYSKTITSLGYNMPQFDISTINLRKNFPPIGMALSVGYWCPVFSHSKSVQYYPEHTLTNDVWRADQSGVVFRFEWYIIGSKELERSKVKTYFDTDGRSK